MAKKFTFKKEPRETGLAGVGAGEMTTIKLNKKDCGLIAKDGWRNQWENWKIVIAVEKSEVESEGSNCKWKNIQFIQRFKTQPEARVWLNNNFEKINDKYTIHYYDD